MNDKPALVAALTLAIVASSGERKARAEELAERVAFWMTPEEVETAARMAAKYTEGMGR